MSVREALPGPEFDFLEILLEALVESPIGANRSLPENASTARSE